MLVVVVVFMLELIVYWLADNMVFQEFSMVRFDGDKEKADAVYKGVDPLTPEDIAEVVVFTAGRKENVVIADTLIFPNHQVSPLGSKATRASLKLTGQLVGGRHSNASKVVTPHRELVKWKTKMIFS